MKEKSCCFTGHRVIPPEALPALLEELERTLNQLIQDGVCCFLAGGALGFDMLAAETILRLKDHNPRLVLILALPCLEQTRGWPPEEVRRYNEILQKADRIVWVSEHYAPGCMHRRNRYMVEHSSICVAYCTRSTGGSAYTVQYAQKRGLKVLHLLRDFSF